jgi:hypothetical protein
MDFRAMLKKKNYGKWDNDDQDPDWGDLKHVEEEAMPVLKKVEKVSRKKNNLVMALFRGYTFLSNIKMPRRVRREKLMTIWRGPNISLEMRSSRMSQRNKKTSKTTSAKNQLIPMAEQMTNKTTASTSTVLWPLTQPFCSPAHLQSP